MTILPELASAESQEKGMKLERNALLTLIEIVEMTWMTWSGTWKTENRFFWRSRNWWRNTQNFVVVTNILQHSGWLVLCLKTTAACTWNFGPNWTRHPGIRYGFFPWSFFSTAGCWIYIIFSKCVFLNPISRKKLSFLRFSQNGPETGKSVHLLWIGIDHAGAFSVDLEVKFHGGLSRLMLETCSRNRGFFSGTQRIGFWNSELRLRVVQKHVNLNPFEIWILEFLNHS